MFNYYLWEQAYLHIGIEALQNNFIRLNEIISLNEKHDHFLHSEKLWNVMIDHEHEFSICAYNALPDKQFMRNVLPKILVRLNQCRPIADKEDLDQEFRDKLNAFWGEIFHQPKETFCLSTMEDYKTFRHKSVLDNINTENFWQWKDCLFEKIKFCDGVKEQIERMGSSRFFQQMVNRLVDLDNYNKTWTQGTCTPNQINGATSLRVTNESDTIRNDKTLKSYRMFQLPNGETEYFEMHIKAGELRIHFFPLEAEHTIYIGYIGSHLPLKK